MTSTQSLQPVNVMQGITLMYQKTRMGDKISSHEYKPNTKKHMKVYCVRERVQAPSDVAAHREGHA